MRQRSERRPIPILFAEFDAKYPAVYRLYRLYAEQLLRAGRRKGGSRAIWERLRWEIMTGKKFEGEEFKLNDHYVPHYARKLAREDPRFKDFFEFRELRNVTLDPGSTPLDMAAE